MKHFIATGLATLKNNDYFRLDVSLITDAIGGAENFCIQDIVVNETTRTFTKEQKERQIAFVQNTFKNLPTTKSAVVAWAEEHNLTLIFREANGSNSETLNEEDTSLSVSLSVSGNF